MLSGVGPAAQLRAHGIEPLVDAPVGDGLQDHPLCLPEWCTPSVSSLWEQLTPENLELWRREHRGPMSSSGAETGGFARTRDGLPAPDLQTGALPGPAPDPELALAPERRIAQIVIAVEVHSRGRLTLRSGDPFDAPLIDPGYLTEAADLEVLMTGVRQAREIAACGPLAEIADGEHAPGDRVSDDAALADWIRATVATAFHPACTCAMGAGDEAVCDPALRVRGVDALRVVDASVMPVLPRGNTNAPTIAIAERAADLIRGVAPLAAEEAMSR